MYTVKKLIEDLSEPRPILKVSELIKELTTILRDYDDPFIGIQMFPGLTEPETWLLKDLCVLQKGRLVMIFPKRPKNI